MTDTKTVEKEPELTAQQQLIRGVFPLAKEAEDKQADAQAKSDREAFAKIQKQRATPKDAHAAPDEAEQPKDADAVKADPAPEAKTEVKVDPLVKAKETLKRTAKVRDDILEGMSDADITAWADEVDGDIAKREKSYRELKERMNALEAKETNEEDPESKEDVQSPSDDPEQSLSKIVDPFQKLFSDEFGDDLGKRAGDALTKIAERLQSRMDARIEALEGDVSGVVQSEQQKLAKEARDALGEAYPQVLDSDDDWVAVNNKARVLAKAAHEDGQPYEDMPALMLDAARVALGDAPAQSKSKSRAKVTAERDNAQPTSPDQKQHANTESLPNSEKERLYFLALKKNKSAGMSRSKSVQAARREAGLE